MARKESTQLRVNLPTGAATITAVPVNAPAWAKTLVVKVLATTAGASTVDFKLVEDNPDGTGTDLDLLAMTQIAASGTNIQRYVVMHGKGGNAVTGNYAHLGMPLSDTMKYLYTIAGTVTDLKIWFCFIGDK
jgi:hypothetical protein